MFATSPDWSLVVIVGLGLLALTVFGFWFRRRQGAVKLASAGAGRLSSVDLGGDIGLNATLVMFSTRFCSICPSARAFFESLVAEMSVDDAAGASVRFYEVDAEKDLALAKRFGVKSTPTTLVLNARGEVAARIIGAPNRANTIAILNKVSGLEPLTAAKTEAI
jgi:thiol-disulfide isomerase/thioredoxin